MVDRRGFLGQIGKTTLAGAFLLNDPAQLILPKEDGIVLATELPPAPLATVTFAYATVRVEDVDPERFYPREGGFPKRVQSGMVHVQIQGFVEEFRRDEAYYAAGHNGERLRLYLTKEA
jgi:hypothetical protein